MALLLNNFIRIVIEILEVINKIVPIFMIKSMYKFFRITV